MRLIYEDGAFEESAEAAAWYAIRGTDLRDRFLDEWKAAEDRMVANSLLYRCFKAGLRKCQFRDFPYLLIFRLERDSIKIVAVMHTSRRPGYREERE